MTPPISMFHGILKLKTLCVGGHFTRITNETKPNQFPANVFAHTENFLFFTVAEFDKALDLVIRDGDIDLVFIDADYDALSEITTFITQAREVRPKLPVIVFTLEPDDRMKQLLREGATWHFTKQSPKLVDLAEQIQRHVFSSKDWPGIFAHYANELIKPRIEPGLSSSDLDALVANPEERYIIKRLFAGSDVVQIFRMDEGFSGSRIYTVKATHELKRILKIDAADKLESILEKQERLIQPRLNRQVGQLQGKLVRGEHLAGTCYALAGSNHDAITLTQLMQDQNRVRKALIDKVLDHLRMSLEQLYAGSSDTELRYWAPLYARVLPPHLHLQDAVLVEEDEEADFVVANDDFSTLSSVPGNRTLQQIRTAVANGQQPEIVLKGFTVVEMDTRVGEIYLHDDLCVRYPISPLLQGKNHPILRFKVRLADSQQKMLTHPVFRRGKRVCVRGRVVATQETILASRIAEIAGASFDYVSDTFEFMAGRFLSPVKNVQALLWEIGREDMIMPIPLVSPVVHGDLNTSNILVEIDETSDENTLVWLIDFSDARPGHVYFDLAKLEVEFRTHVLFRLFKDMVDEGLWDEETAVRFAMLIENILWQSSDIKFDEFLTRLRDFMPDWFDNLYMQFPLYSENLLYFLFSLRQIAKTYSPERFKYHYPVAVFFHSMAAMKFTELDNEPWYPWARRLALGCGLVAGKLATEMVDNLREVSAVLSDLKQRSSFALITVGSGDERKYLLQWNDNWGMFNLVGGKIDNAKGDKDSFARTIQRELLEELGLRSPKDYRIYREFPPLRKRQFSRREFVFKDYEFRIFQIEFLPRHPGTVEEYEWFAQRLSGDRENVLVSRAEIERLRTFDNRPISDTTRVILQELGEIPPYEADEFYTSLEFELESKHVIVSRGRAQLQGVLVNPDFGHLVENVTLEMIPSTSYEVEKDSAILSVGTMPVNDRRKVSLWLYPKEKQAVVKIRATYFDIRGNEYKQVIETAVTFDALNHSVFHIDNPYVVGKPLTPASESLYVGREDVFMWIEENLLGKTQPHTLILYGQRRMGKTSTLYQLVGGHRGATIREYPAYPIFPVYIDLQSLAGCDTQEFFIRLSQIIARNFYKRNIRIEVPQKWSENGSIYGEFDAFLDQVERAMPENGLLVLVMDELEQLQVSVENGRLSSDIFPYLRSLMQHRARLTFILAGTNQLVEDYWSIIFHVGISREIMPLSRSEIETLIREPVAPMIQYDDLAVDRIWLATKGQPYFTQLICHRLISSTNLEGRRSKLITLADVRETIDHIIQQDDSHLQHLWNESSPNERYVMAALAGGNEMAEESVSRAEVATRLRDFPLDDEEMNGALKRLELRRLLMRQPIERQIQTRIPRPGGWQPTLISRDYAYEFSFDLMRQWVATKHPLGSMLQLSSKV
ncbi:MAG: hypothetical protein Kow0080_18330 [Candidatus Promineifilaceae bacterium]